LGIVTARFIYPSLTYDADSRDLILIALACVLVPDIARLVARVRRLKVGDNEIELDEALDELTRKTEKAEEELEESVDIERELAPPPDVQRYVRDPRGGLIAIAVDIEERINQLIAQHQLQGLRRYVSPVRGAELLATRGYAVKELPVLMRDFWVVRNMVVHSKDVSLTEKDIYRLVDLGLRILELLSVKKSNG
jgi:hypothetical protein